MHAHAKPVFHDTRFGRPRPSHEPGSCDVRRVQPENVTNTPDRFYGFRRKKGSGFGFRTREYRRGSEPFLPSTLNPELYSPFSLSQSKTSRSCPSGFTFSMTCAILPVLSMTNVVRCTPLYFLPYM